MEEEIDDSEYEEDRPISSVTLEKEIKSKRGKKSRASGQRFELKVRADLESKGWIVAKWSNNVGYVGNNDGTLENIKKLKLIPAKSNRFNMRTCGFPDFIAFRYFSQAIINGGDIGVYKIIGVECKVNGYLDKVEKEKCRWLTENNKFSKILIASKGKKRGEIIYKEFK